jgi:two-component sensor histidine kinase
MNELFDGATDPMDADATLKTPTKPDKRPEQQIQELASTVATSVKTTATEVVSSLTRAKTDSGTGTASAIAVSVIAAAEAAAVTVEAAAAAAAAALAVQAAAAALIASAVEETVASSARAAALEAQAATTAAAVAVETAVRAAALAVALAERTAMEAARALATEKAAAQALQLALNDKQALLMEVHHRVKNNLQVIVSLLRLEAGRSQHPDVHAVLADMQGRIRSMALLHKALYRSGTFASVDLGNYLQQVTTQSFSSQSKHPDLVRLTLNFGSVQVGMDQAISAGLLVNELISNCLKHGFPQQRSGEVNVVLQPVVTETQAADPLWYLCVSDTGVGLSSDFEERRKTSLGLQLVHDLSQQIGGSLVVASKPGLGAQFTVIFTALAPKTLVMPL